MFTKRSSEKELIDLGKPYYSCEEYQDCMRKLFQINLLLSIFHRTLNIIKKNASIRTVLDIGCGSGLFLLNLYKKHPQLTYKGIDINPEAISLAQQNLRKFSVQNKLNINFKVQNIESLLAAAKTYDMVLVTLTCHHLTDKELVIFFSKTKSIK